MCLQLKCYILICTLNFFYQRKSLIWAKSSRMLMVQIEMCSVFKLEQTERMKGAVVLGTIMI